MTWEVVIGLETHTQLTTASKIFSGASTQFGAAPNTQASAVDLAMPGTLPVLNKGAVERAIRFGLAVGGRIAATSIFARKNYFYPDLPKGYQISQFELPVVVGGSLAFMVGDEERRVNLTRAHLEEDAGKLLHEEFHGKSGVDLNRAGTPLLEIVSEPEMRSAAEAVAYAKALHSLVRWIGICDGNMQEGSFRCDANVSVRRPGAPLGTRCEIKNLNSFRFLERAIEYEVRRQVELIEDGGKVVQETRLYDPDAGETRAMRSKEDAQDYRYFPDPDLLPLAITAEWIETVKAAMPELPGLARARISEICPSLSAREVAQLTASLETLHFYDDAVSRVQKFLPGPGAGKAVANWVLGELAAKLNDSNLTIDQSRVTSAQVARLIDRVTDDTISSRGAKTVFADLWEHGGEVDQSIERLNLKQVSDSGAIEAAIDQVLAANAKQVDDYRAGKERAFNSLVGQVMKATKGQANPAQVNEILRRKLAG